MVQKVDFPNIIVKPENRRLYYLNFEAEKQLFLESLLEYTTECFACARERHVFIVDSVHFLASVKFIYKNG